MLDFIKEAANVRPSENQLRLLTETPFYAFIHFSPNTYTGLEWGTGKENPSVFNPLELDCDGWCEAIKSAGMKGVIITAKHHDGFCLWQSKYTEHCMKNSPYKNGKGDVVKELSEACEKHGLKFGFYLSPWDRNSKYYGTPEYNTYYKNQLTELLTNYGEIFHVWFDGACGEGPDGKKQVYDFQGFIELIEKYQPKATFFNDKGVVRWCGNESGTARHSEWAVVPSELCPLNKNIQTGKMPLSDGDLSYMYNWDGNIGALSNIIYSKGLVFSPAEIDMSIRKGWFYHPEEEPHSLDRLFNTYINSVGSNTTFNLNIPPMPNGRFDERDIKRLKELGDLIKSSFSVDYVKSVTETALGATDTQFTYTVLLNKNIEAQYLEICEDLTVGQRIENFIVSAEKEDGTYRHIADLTTVGNKKIVKLGGVKTDKIKVDVVSSRLKPAIKKISVY